MSSGCSKPGTPQLGSLLGDLREGKVEAGRMEQQLQVAEDKAQGISGNSPAFSSTCNEAVEGEERGEGQQGLNTVLRSGRNQSRAFLCQLCISIESILSGRHGSPSPTHPCSSQPANACHKAYGCSEYTSLLC